MRTNDIIKEIQRLPVSKRIYVVEKTIHSIRTQGDKNLMKKAADVLYSDYPSAAARLHRVAGKLSSKQ